MVKAILAVAAGGACGAVGRYMVMVGATRLLGLHFPFGTLIVNIVGSFLLGMLAEGLALAWTVSPETRLFLVVGFLGAFTTFSTFSLDVVSLYQRGQVLLAAVYLLSSVVLSVGALFAGLRAMRQILGPV